MPSASSETLSVIIPVYNEEESLAPLVEAILAVKKSHALAIAEILLVDDGSTDGSWQVIESLASKHTLAQGVRLRRNFGKSVALDTGIRHSKGDIIVTLDADLQDDPEEIPQLLAKLREGYDLVTGWKKERNDPLSKTLPSRLFNAVTARLTGLKLHDFNSGFKLFRRAMVDSVRLYGELHRYIPVFAHNFGYKVAEIPVKHHPRRFGKSKFGIERYARGLLDLFTVLTITRYSRRPGHLFGGIGLLLGMAGFCILIYLSVLWFFTTDPIGNRPLLLFGVMFSILSVQFVFFGMLAEFMLHRSTIHEPRDKVAETTK